MKIYQKESKQLQDTLAVLKYCKTFWMYYSWGCYVLEETSFWWWFFFFFALLSKGCLETDKFPNAMTHLKPLGLS